MLQGTSFDKWMCSAHTRTLGLPFSLLLPLAPRGENLQVRLHGAHGARLILSAIHGMVIPWQC